MNERELPAEQFEAYRPHLRRVAYRILGSLNEADDAVQESWLRVSRANAGSVENLGGWLTTIVGRVCLDMLRARKRRIEDPLEVLDDEQEPRGGEHGLDPDRAVLLADSVGLALLVVLEKLSPGERIAYVLHDMFDLPFDKIADIVARTPEAARQLASRARRRVQNGGPLPQVDRARQRELVEGFLAASRNGDFEALIAVLDPDVVIRGDEAASPDATVREARGASRVARGALGGPADLATIRAVFVNGAAGLAHVVDGRPVTVLEFVVGDTGILEIEVIRAPQTIRRLDLADLDDGPQQRGN
jgi:RNA polymerase sigma-70 factor (ECF subfamily)